MVFIDNSTIGAFRSIQEAQQLEANTPQSLQELDETLNTT